MNSPPAHLLAAGPPDLGPTRRRRGRRRAVATALPVIVLTAALITYVANRGPADADQHPPLSTRHISTRHINTRHISTRHISTRHISTRHISTRHISTRHISTRHISTRHISTRRRGGTAERTTIDRPADALAP